MQTALHRGVTNATVAPAAVMATGIVSLALREEGWGGAATAMTWIAAALWVGITCLLLARWPDTSEPSVLTAVAATCVLGSCLTERGWRWAGAGLLAIGAALWIAFLPRVLRAWRTPTTGGSFLVTVSTASLAVLALALPSGWWRVAAGLLAAVAALLYVMVAVRFDPRELADGAGDQWVAAGALAILALALAPLSAPLALAAWAAATAWLPALAAGEIVRPRLRWDVRRWATVFPLGMYSVASGAVASAASVPALATVGHVFGWIAAAAWAVAALAQARSLGS